MLLRDFRVLDHVQILSESKSNGTMKIRGLFQRANEANQNGRIYPKKILESAIKDLQPMIKGNRLYGELDHPPGEIVKLTNASHLITKMEMRGNDVIGEATILPTHTGLIAQAIIKAGGQLGISSRGTGSVKEVNENLSEVQADYKMITLDLVADPSVAEALPGLCESKIASEQNKQITEEAIKQVYGEKVFIQMLKQALQEGKQMAEKKTVRENLALVKKVARQRRNMKNRPDRAGSKKGSDLHPVVQKRVNRLKKAGEISGKSNFSKKSKDRDEVDEGSRGDKALNRKMLYAKRNEAPGNKVNKGKTNKSKFSFKSSDKQVMSQSTRKMARDAKLKEELVSKILDNKKK